MFARSFRTNLLAAATIAVAATPVLAQVDARRLQGQSTASAIRTLTDMGYRESRRHSEGGSNWIYYLNKGATNPCIGITSRDGQVDGATGFPISKCQSDGTGAAVAGVAIAALLGAALLSHGDKHHKDGQHLTNQNQEASYERGYRDGLHQGQFVNYDHNIAYSDGYAAGARERENQLRSNQYHYTASQRGNHRADLAASCARDAANYWRVDPYNVTTYDVRSTGGGMSEVKVASGYQTGTCTVSNDGTVRGIMNDR